MERLPPIWQLPSAASESALVLRAVEDLKDDAGVVGEAADNGVVHLDRCQHIQLVLANCYGEHSLCTEPLEDVHDTLEHVHASAFRAVRDRVQMHGANAQDDVLSFVFQQCFPQPGRHSDGDGAIQADEM